MPSPYLATIQRKQGFPAALERLPRRGALPQGVDVNLVLSYLVTTAMSKVRRTSLLIPNPKQFVRATLGKVGLPGARRTLPTHIPRGWSYARLPVGGESTIGSGGTIGL